MPATIPLLTQEQVKCGKVEKTGGFFMYQIDELVVYGNMGVCRIVAIKPGNQIGIEQEELYYVLEPLYQKCKVSVPVDAKQVFMRPIISKAEAEELIKLIPSVQAKTIPSSDQRALEELYKSRIRTHNCQDLINLTTAIYAKTQIAEREKGKVAAVDVRFMQLAEDQLFGELGAALGIEKDQVQSHIAAQAAIQQHQKKKIRIKK
jgi:CarD family transcriptional regulator